ncbi:hypothetical protein N7520_004806 [Penicillium odoratum]|uniref:uncharacterized protein n=1 Tax=Penicillium odoratum TaxID=1167516 RepID=UPI0025481121|nr:uncharacterized protein N7520_004806 [Penicillium odoratum]KAJ5765247.1 hypothetical protein N7520_004806 [Penicillium odoratum]
MPGTYSHIDMLSGTLSARSYLELGELAPGAETPQSLDSAPGTPLEAESRSGPHLRPRRRQTKSEKTETGPASVRKRGRPRLETAKDAAAIEERRMQIRRAQRTYREKKESTIKTLKTRVDVLEQALQNVSDLLTDSSSIPHDQIQTKQLILAEINKARSFSDETFSHNNPESLRDIFGYNVSPQYTSLCSSKSSAGSIPRSPSPLLNRLFPETTIYTYSHQESDLSRRLHRFCLEHTYRWLTDPHSDPVLMTRVFGLLPCIHDIPGVCRNFRRILRSEIGNPLESSKLPFYTLGGAGTHFPRADEPKNVRRPGKILRRLVRIMKRGGIQDWDEDWSGDVELDELEMAVSTENRMRALDLDGDWFDCRDVQGYLEYCGVVLDGSSLLLDVPAQTVGDLYRGSRSYGLSGNSGDMGHWGSPDQSTYVLDVECFFNLLLVNLRILGRAPGFRRWDVDAALRTSIHRRSFG